MKRPLPLHTALSFCMALLLTNSSLQAQCVLTLNCPGDTTILLAPGQCSSIYSYLIDTSSVDCVVTTLEQTDMSGFTSGDAFPIGITAQSYRYFDDTGVEMICDFNVEVVANIDSVLTLTCNDEVNISVNGFCEVYVTPDMVLEGDHYGCIPEENIVIKTLSGTIVSNPVRLTADNQATSYYVEITHPITNVKCWTQINLEDKSIPEIECDCPPEEWMNDPDCRKLCTDIQDIIDGTIGIPTTYDNCRPTRALLNDFAINPGTLCGEHIVTQYWTVQYLDGDSTIVGSVNCESEYYIDRSFITDIVWPLDTIIDCTLADVPNITHPDSTGYPTLNGEDLHSGNMPENLYCSISVTYTDLEIPTCGDDCKRTKKIIRTWTKLDWCTAEVFEHAQVIKILDNEAPEIEIETFQTFYTDVYTCFGDIWFDDPILSDNCDPNLDWYILSSDSGGILVDEDGLNISNKPKKHAIKVPKGMWTFRIASVDCCGNMAIQNVEVNLVDATPPVIVALEYINVSLSNDPLDPEDIGGGKLFTSSVDQGSYDNCSGIHMEIRRHTDACDIEGNTTYSDILPVQCDPWYDNNDPDGGQFVKFCCEDLNADGDGDGIVDGLVKVWVRVWDDANMDGYFGSSNFIDNPGNDHDYCAMLDNYNEAWIWVKVEDKLGPLVDCPDDITILCDEDPTDLTITGEAIAYSVCEDLGVSYEDDAEVHCGGGIIWRRWTADGTTNSCIQKITVEPSHQFVLECPIDPETMENKATVYCDNYDIPEPNYTIGACDLVGISSSLDTFWLEDDACYKVIKEWIFLDWCTGNADTCNFVLYKADESAPEIACQDTCIGLDDFWDLNNNGITCELASNPAISILATDNGDCSSEWLKWEVDVDYWGDGTVDRTYSSNLHPTDPDYTAPSLSGEYKVLNLDKNDVSAEWARHILKWKVNDGCGNFSSCTQVVEITDKKAPTPYCAALSIAIMQGTTPTAVIWAEDFNIGSFDNCTDKIDLLYTFDKVPPVEDKLDQIHCFDETGTEVPCSQYENGYPIQRWDPVAGSSGIKLIGTTWCGKNTFTISVWDEKFNTDYCETTLQVSGEACMVVAGLNTTVAGNIATETGDRVPNVEVHLMTTDPDYPKDEITNTDGIYSFYDNPEWMNYTITPEKDGDDLNGVSTLDILYIQKHILGLQELSSPYKMIAADINADEKITGIDIVELRKLVLGVYSELPQTDSWVFAEKAAIMNPDSPWPFVQEINLYGLDQNFINEDFIAIKVGDVNESVTANLANLETENRNEEPVDIHLSLEDNQIQFRAGSNFDNVHGFQFVLKGAINIKEVIPAALQIGLQHFASSRDRIACSFDSKEMITVSEGDLLFSLNILAIKDEIAIENKLISPEVYLGNSLEVNSLNLVLDELVRVYSIKNKPNPFNESTEITFSLPRDEKATIRVFDLAGRMLFSHEEDYTKGTHSVQIDAKHLGGIAGVYFYELKTKTFTELKRMMLVE